MRIAILGYGEIGKAVEKVYLEKGIQPFIKDLDRDDDIPLGCDVFHVCIPYTDMFDEIVDKAILKYAPRMTVINSTVAPGTTAKLENIHNVVHSPVRGVHPDLFEGLMTFKKVVGGNCAETAVEHFNALGMSAVAYDDSITTEVAKLLSTTYYGVCIAFHDYARRVCEASGANFEQAMTQWNSDYNEGYTELGKANVVRPVLTPPEGSIGGHCVVPNAEIIKEVVHSPLVQSILNLK